MANLFSTRNIQLATSFNHHTLDGSKLLASSLGDITEGTIFTDLTVKAPSDELKVVRFKFQKDKSYKETLEQALCTHQTASVER